MSAIKTVCHFCFTRKDNHNEQKIQSLLCFFTASAKYLRGLPQSNHKRAENAIVFLGDNIEVLLPSFSLLCIGIEIESFENVLFGTLSGGVPTVLVDKQHRGQLLVADV